MTQPMANKLNCAQPKQRIRHFETWYRQKQRMHYVMDANIAIPSTSKAVAIASD